MNNSELERKKIEILLDSDDLSFEQIIDIKIKMMQFQYSSSDINDLDDMLEDCFDLMNYDELVEAKNYMKSCGLNTNLVEKYIKRKSSISINLLASMDKDDILYVLDNQDLSIDLLLYIKRISELKEFDSDSINWVNEKIDEYIEELNTYEETKKCIDLFYSNGFYDEKLEMIFENIKSKYSREQIDNINNKLSNQISKENEEVDSFFNMNQLNKHNTSVCGELYSWDLNRYLQTIPIFNIET